MMALMQLIFEYYDDDDDDDDDDNDDDGDDKWLIYPTFQGL